MRKTRRSFSIVNFQLSIFRWRSQRGQIALIVLLLMTLMLTIGLAVAQRGLFDTKVTQQEEEASRAFQAAETGVEEALRTLTGTSGPKDLTSGVTYDVTVVDQGQDGFVTTDAVATGEVLELELADATATAVDIYFRQNPNGCAASGAWGLEVETVYEDLVGERGVRREVYMSQVDGDYTLLGTGFCKLVDDFPIITGALKLRVRPVGVIDSGVLPTGTLLGLAPANGTLPPQYRLIRSEGVAGVGVTRAVSVTRSLPQLPTIFDYALFSGDDLIKVKPQFTPYVPDPADYELTESIPAESATWPAGPVYVLATFNMDLHGSSSLQITDNSTGASVNSGSTALEDNNRRMRQKTTIGVPTVQKTYTVTWKPCVSAGNCRTTNNTFTFTVNPDFTLYADLRASNTVTIRLGNVVGGTGLDLPKVRMTRGKTLRFRNTISGQKRVITDMHLTGHTYMLNSAGNVWRTSKLANGDQDTVSTSERGAYYYHGDDGSDNYLSGYDGIVVVE